MTNSNVVKIMTMVSACDQKTEEKKYFDNTYGLRTGTISRQIYAIAFLFSLVIIYFVYLLSSFKCYCFYPSFYLWVWCIVRLKWKAHYLIWFILICRELVWRRRKKKLWHRTEQTLLLSLLQQFVVCVCLCRCWFFLSRKKKM